MQPVTVYDNDVAETDDTNRISEFAEAAFENLLESITQGKRNLLWGGVSPFIQSQSAPQITIRVPQQYFAIEARSALFPQTDIVINHPNPGTDHDFFIYLMLRLADQEEERDNVDPGTFVVTPTDRVTHRLEETEFSVLNVVTGDPQVFPATGVGVPGPGLERLGFVEIASFTWDGTATVPVVTLNTGAVVSLGTAGLPLHGPSHVTTDPIPHVNDVNRGMMPRRSQGVLKNSIIRVEAAAGEPFSISTIGQNGPSGVYNFDVFNAGSARGVELELLHDGSLEKVSNQLRVRYGTPTNGVAGGSDRAARADHQHWVPQQQTYRTHTDGGAASWADGLSAPYAAPPNVLRPIDNFGPALAHVVLLVDLFCTGPNNSTPFQLELEGNGGITRWVTCRASGPGDAVGQTTMVFIQLNPGGQVTVKGHNMDSTSRYRVSVIGVFGQG